MKKRILIIGGAGFIGHNLAIYLKKIGAKVEILDNLEVNNLGSLKKNVNNVPDPKLSMQIIRERLRLLKKNNIKINKVDAKNHFLVKKIIEKFKPKVVIHLAAVSHANRSNVNPHHTFDNSLRTLGNVLDNVKNKIDHFIFLSSSMVYGNFKKKTVKEDDICNPIGVYGGLKYAAEEIIKSYSQVFNLPYTIIRPSALYGERCISRRVGQIFIENALNKKIIKIQGDGEEKLDFTYINDLVEGIVKVIKKNNSKNQIFNLTYGKSEKINSLLKLISSQFKNVQTNYTTRDKLMPKRGTLSTLKAKKLLNYKSKWPIGTGYIKYINWYKDFYSKKNKY